MGKILVLILCLFAGTMGKQAHAGHNKPAGVPEIFLPEYNKTIAVFAVTSPVGSGLAVLERQSDGTYVPCGICSRYVSDLGAEIAFKGGVKPYIESMVSEINDILVYQYPAKTGPKPGTTAIENLNYALYESYRLSIVNGQATFGAK